MLTNSFDIKSVFTNVTLAGTIQICTDALFSSENPPASFLRHIFVELMEVATSSVEFSVDDISGVRRIFQWGGVFKSDIKNLFAIYALANK